MRKPYLFFAALGLLFVYFFCEILPFRAAARVPVSDSELVARYVLQIQKRCAAQEGEDTASLDDYQVDSLLRESRVIVGGTVYYAPDSSFKIINIGVETCGMHCSTEWYSWTHFDLKTKPKIDLPDFGDGDNNFLPIDTIYRMPDGKYVVVQHEDGANGPIGVRLLRANLISFERDSVWLDPIPYGDGYSLTLLHELTDEEHIPAPQIRFDPDSQLLKYRYNRQELIEVNLIDSTHDGQFRYVNGEFVFDKERVTAGH